MYYRLITIILICILSVQAITGQSFSEKKNYKKAMRINRETHLELDNKYGNIHVTQWEKDSVSVTAEIEATASSLQKLRKMFDGIEVNISEDDNLVKVETEFNENINDLLETIKGLTEKLIPYESRVQINYVIHAPDYIDTRITNKYGDVYIENITGKFSLDLANGSFKANSLSESNDLRLVFCNATINSIIRSDINASFSEIAIDESQDLEISSISSRFDIKKAGNIKIESRRDKFYIGTVNSMTGKSYFTDFRIDNLTQEIDLETKYGNLDANRIEKNVQRISINSNYTDIDLTFDPAISYNLDIRHLNSFVVLPEKNSNIEKKVTNEDKNEYLIVGSVGRDPGNLKVTINATRGNIYLK